jgi:RNA recognition motif-containing protein
MVGVCVQARAVRNLWIGGISPAISKQELQEEFQKFGKIEGVAFSRDLHTSTLRSWKMQFLRIEVHAVYHVLDLARSVAVIVPVNFLKLHLSFQTSNGIIFLSCH